MKSKIFFKSFFKLNDFSSQWSPYRINNENNLEINNSSRNEEVCTEIFTDYFIFDRSIFN